MATLTREEMEQIIDSGGSVLHNRQIITDKAALPSAAELAQGDAAAMEHVRLALEAQRDAIEDQLDHLGQIPKVIAPSSQGQRSQAQATPVQQQQRPAQPGQVQQAPR